MSASSSQLPLLIELGTEELPPKSLAVLAQAFADGIAQGLTKRGIGFDANALECFYTPRRLALRINAVETLQADQAQERRGPALNAGLDSDGNPSKALQGFAASCGVEVSALEKLETDKGAWFVYRSLNKGAALSALLQSIIDEALKALPIPKPMRWGDREISFVRPAHWLLVLLGNEIVKAEILGLKSGRASRGHRFHHPDSFDIAAPADYVEALRKAHVLVDPNERREKIRADVSAKAQAAGGVAAISDALLDEVANLTEWPVAIACQFEREFLTVPAEALVTTMETNQKFFAVRDANGKLTEHFIGVANIDSKDPAEIRKGYERVIRPRFADAKFFYEQDLKTPLIENLDALKQVTYQQKLGSTWQKTLRVTELARIIAPRVGVDAAQAVRAASLAKCDLMTRMVGEFPELQGVMGRYYAAAQGEQNEVSNALDECYQPRNAGDAVAPSQLGKVIAIAERLDTLAGLFAIGMKPSGNKDPFALRRAAQGLARTLIEGKLDLDLHVLFTEAAQSVKDGVPEHTNEITVTTIAKELLEFTMERLRAYYAERGITSDSFDAVLAVNTSSLLDFDQRLNAIVKFSVLPEASSLAAANKRISNILRQANERGEKPAAKFDDALMESVAESALAKAIATASAQLLPLMQKRDYVAALQALSALQQPVDAFFDGVMVMAENDAVRQNRLGVLAQLRGLFLEIADVSLLQSV